MGGDVSEFLEAFADLSMLLYHEARNVRHLVREGYASAETYQGLLKISGKKYVAWQEVQPIRQRARRAETAARVRQVFEPQFALGLPDLVVLFQNPGWHSASSRGGNPWENIARAVDDLSAKLDKGDWDNARNLILLLVRMRHNIGVVGDKLQDLDQNLSQSENISAHWIRYFS